MMSLKKKQALIVLIVFVICIILTNQHAHARTWLRTEVVSTESSKDSKNASLAVGSGTVHIAWKDNTTGNRQSNIFYKRKEGGGAWSELNQTLSWIEGQPSEGALDPSVGFGADGTVHVAWADYTDYAESGTDSDIFYKIYLPVQQAYWTVLMIVSRESNYFSTTPSLDVSSDGRMHIVWVESATICYKSYVLAGGFPEPTALSTSGNMALEPSLRVGPDGTVHIAWVEYNNSNPNDRDIVYRRYESNAWTPILMVSTQSTGRASYPSLVVDPDGVVHFVWQDNTDITSDSGNDDDIFYKSYDPSNDTWTTTRLVSKESIGYSVFPSVDVGSNGRIHITWQDATDYDNSGDDWDIFYKSYDPKREEWTTTDVVSTESSGVSMKPSLRVSSGFNGPIHIAWEDNTNYDGSGDDYDIFYNKMYLWGAWWKYVPWLGGFVLLILAYVAVRYLRRP